MIRQLLLSCPVCRQRTRHLVFCRWRPRPVDPLTWVGAVLAAVVCFWLAAYLLTGWLGVAAITTLALIGFGLLSLPKGPPAGPYRAEEVVGAVGSSESVPLHEIAEQRRRGWPDFHPEAFCHRCGRRNVSSWHAPSPLWNAVMRGDGREPYEGIVCPQCFATLAEAAGIRDRFGSWHFGLHETAVELPATDADGRLWDPESCLWVDAA